MAIFNSYVSLPEGILMYLLLRWVFFLRGGQQPNDLGPSGYGVSKGPRPGSSSRGQKVDAKKELQSDAKKVGSSGLMSHGRDGSWWDLGYLRDSWCDFGLKNCPISYMNFTHFRLISCVFACFTLPKYCMPAIIIKPWPELPGEGKFCEGSESKVSEVS